MTRLPVTSVAATVVALAVLAGSAPASAHEEISPPTVPTGRPAYLVLSVANEKRVDLTRVTINAPAGGQFGHATRDPAGWTSTLTHTVATWTGGAVKPSRFEQFGFDIEAVGQPGTLVYQVSLGYADGSTSQADVSLQAVAAGTVTTAPPGTTTSAAAPGTASTAVAGGPTTVAPSGTGGGLEGGGGGESRANLALGLSAFALVVAMGAVAAGRRAAPASPATRAEGQDW